MLQRPEQSPRKISCLMDQNHWLLFFFFFIYFNWRLTTLQYCSDFAIHLHESAMGVHVFPILTFPPHPITQGYPSAPALRTLSHASNLDWRSISHMIIYMFQCYSLKSSHPRLLPQSPKVCSLHLCLFCWLLKAKMKYCTVLKILEDLTIVYFLGYERLGGSIAQEKASTVGRTWAEGLIYASLSSRFVMLGHLRIFT